MASPSLSQQTADALVHRAVAHMQLQVAQVSQTQHALNQLWNRVVDPADMAGSFNRFVIGAESMILAAQSRGQLTAQQFYTDSRALAGITTALPDVPPIPTNIAADLSSLYATGLAEGQRLQRAGRNASAASNAAKAALLRAAQRRILAAPRRRIISLSEADDEARGWARVGDGDPCYFCAMLIGRGPVYHSEATANFRAHDGCGCSARMVFNGDPSGGWTTDSWALHRAWYKAEDGARIDYHNGHTLQSWRQAYTDLRADPHSSLNTALHGPRGAYTRAA